MKKILIISIRDDIHCQEVIKHLKKDQYYYLESDNIPFLDLQFNKKLKIKIANLDIVTDIKSIWFRKPEFTNPDFTNLKTINKKLKAGVYYEYKKRSIFKVIDHLSHIAKEQDIFYLNNPTDLGYASNKLTQLNIASELGFIIPKTIYTNDISTIKKFTKSDACIIKSVNSNVSYGYMVANFPTMKIPKNYFAKTDNNLDYPILVQNQIDLDYDIRVTVIGKQIFACAIDTKEKLNTKILTTYNIKSHKHKIIHLPKEIEQKCFKLMKLLNLNFGAIDLALTKDGQYVFFEINPNGQYLWIEEVTDLPLSKAVADLLKNPDRNKLV